MKTHGILWILFLLFSFLPASCPFTYAAEVAVEVYAKNGMGEAIPAAHVAITLDRITSEKDGQLLRAEMEKVGTMQILDKNYSDGTYTVRIQKPYNGGTEVLTLSVPTINFIAYNNLITYGYFIKDLRKWSKRPRAGKVSITGTTNRNGSVIFHSVPPGNYVVACTEFQTAHQYGFWLQFFSVTSKKEKVLLGNDSLYVVKETP